MQLARSYSCMTSPRHQHLWCYFYYKQTSLHLFDFIRSLFHLLVCISFFMISKISVLACVDKKHCLLNLLVYSVTIISQWKMHHCDVLCLVLSSLCSLQAYIYAEHVYNILLFLSTSPDSTSPPTHFTQAPPSHAKNRYLNSRLMILHASELATELFDEVQSPSSKGTSSRNFTAIRGRFVLGTARVKALGWLKKKED